MTTTLATMSADVACRKLRLATTRIHQPTKPGLSCTALRTASNSAFPDRMICMGRVALYVHVVSSTLRLVPTFVTTLEIAWNCSEWVAASHSQPRLPADGNCCVCCSEWVVESAWQPGQSPCSIDDCRRCDGDAERLVAFEGTLDAASSCVALGTLGECSPTSQDEDDEAECERQGEVLIGSSHRGRSDGSRRSSALSPFPSTKTVLPSALAC
mmetsp:Transcript_82463/g.229865  ORF Transcript_82463/g.229865 Transcript_82463/m.229865 type:complete len:213 (+) Transcript_82463:1752-2390(+)